MSGEAFASHVAPAVPGMDGESSGPLENEHFHCSAEWHLARLSPICRLIYPLAYKVSHSKDSAKQAKGQFFASAGALAAYFGYKDCQVRRGLKELQKLGFFQLLSAKKFRANHFRVFSHDEWALKHKGKCTIKVEMPWSGEGDLLGQSLWRVSGGQVKFKAFQVENLRKLRLTDEEVMERFSVYWQQHGQRMKVVNVPPGFYKYVKQECAA